jgi:hypothetical protein
MKKLLLSLFLLCSVSAVQAASPITVTWKDLQGAVEPYNDPFKALTEEQLYNLSVLARITEIQKESPEKVSEARLKMADDAKKSLVADSIDIEYLFDQRLVIMEKRQQAMSSTNGLLADQTIKMAGYMLALTYEDGLVSEFLLVPTFGACSHEPVPDANQIILVTTKTPFAVGAPYEAVTVTGTLRLTSQAKELYLIDGQKQIEMAYSLEDTIVEPYVSKY